MVYHRDTTSITIKNHTRKVLEDLRDNYNDISNISWDDFFIQLCDYVKETLGEEDETNCEE